MAAIVTQSLPQHTEAGPSIPVDWEDVSVKDEPLDDITPNVSQHAVTNDNLVDIKDLIPANSLGSVQYLPAGSAPFLSMESAGEGSSHHPAVATNTHVPMGDVITDGVTVKVEETVTDIDPMMIAPIKEEEDQSYLDNPRFQMSPCDQEIDPDADGVELGSGNYSSRTLMSPTVTVILPARVPKSRAPRTLGTVITHPVADGSVCGKLKPKSVSGKGVGKKSDATTQKKGDGRKGKSSPTSMLPCVVQLCQMGRCAVDCQCTVKAPYPEKLNAVTISTQENVMSLNVTKGKKSDLKSKGTEIGVNPQRTLAVEREEWPNMESLTTQRAERGKRQAKLSDKLKDYIKERHKNDVKQVKKKPSAVTSFNCPICDKGFNYIFSFKQHIITHNVNEILNMNLPQNGVNAKIAAINKKLDSTTKSKAPTPAKRNVTKKPEVTEAANSVTPKYKMIRTMLNRSVENSAGGTKKKQVNPKKTDKDVNRASGVVLKVPQIAKTASLSPPPAKKPKKIMPTTEVSGNIALGEIVSYEKGKKIGEAQITVNDTTRPKTASTSQDVSNQVQQASENSVQAPSFTSAPSTINDPDPQNVIVIAPINDFGTPNEEEDTMPVLTPVNITKTSPKPKLVRPQKTQQKLTKLLKVKKVLKVKISPNKNVNRSIKKSPVIAASTPPTLQIKTSPRPSPRAKPKLSPARTGSSGESSPGRASRKRRQVSSEAGGDSDATAPYGSDADDDDQDKDFLPNEPVDDSDDEDFTPSKKVSGSKKLPHMTDWLKQFSIKKKYQKYRARGLQAVKAKNRKVLGKPAAPVVPMNRARTNRGEDRDSGIDLESDASGKSPQAKQLKDDAAVAPRKEYNQTEKILQTSEGKMVSRKEVWTLVQSNLDNRKQKEPVLCPICAKAFNYPSALKRHVMMHTDEREFGCPHCDKAFSRKPHLTEHIRVHSGERPYKCDHCPAAFAQRTNLKIHIRTHTGARPFKCPECGKRFRRQDAHTQHILTHHSNVKPYKCSECSAAFPCARYLKDHLRVHSSERPFKCELCPSAFVCKKYLLLHVRALHLNERPFQCKLCPAKFAQSGKLTEHNRVHTGERPYKCSSCGASFSRSGHLRRHLLTHTGARPFQCETCDASFSQKDHLKRHMMNIHKD